MLKHYDQPEPRRECPVLTLLCMIAAFVSLFVLIDWSGTSTARPAWLMMLPSAFGVLGALAAGRQGFAGWAIISVAWGVGLVPVLILVLTVLRTP
ncbi:hypothetical protein [Kocuria sp.]|uniref:hypothetical protein n=1 Tax=Kocuria sp. TaxID=1871328 RepID=UPI0026DF2F08|nr:hypothetical protein [Kocuria sp.]MDO5617340.1 hypothetical protein [Kocuria sp.]